VLPVASKYQQITGLYESTIKDVTESTAAWTEFLRSACRNYKCRFDEQILIYAQRPDATAVLEIEKWNKQFGRWVNRGATGIAVFDDEHNQGYRLKHYFDVSDTHESSFTRPVPIWSMDAEYETEVIESLENSFGELDDKSTLADAIVSAARNAVEDNISDYLSDLMNCIDGSALEEFDKEYIQNEYRFILHRSVAYMIMSRCGIDADKYLSDFRPITNFDTGSTVNALGIAASDIAESCLREISATVISLQKERELPASAARRTVAMSETPVHNVNIEQNNERSADNGNDISDGGRLSSTESDRAGNTGSLWQVRITPKEISEREPPRVVSESSDIGQAERTLDGNRADSEQATGSDDHADGTDTGRDGADEIGEPDAVGGDDEQYPAQRGGIGSDRPDIQLKPLPTIAQQLNMFGEAEEVKASAFLPLDLRGEISQQIIDEVLTSGGNEERSVLRIAAYFKKDHETDKNTDFLQNEYRRYGDNGKGFIFGGNHVSVWFEESGIRIAMGNTVLTDTSTSITWEQAARRIRELLDLGRFMPQSELDKVDGDEIKRLADTLWYLRRDVEDKEHFSFIDEDVFRHSFPNDTEKIAELLTLPEQRKEILAGVRELAAAYEENHELLRFRYAVNHLYGVLNGLEDLEREPIIFTADESISAARPGFITQDEVDKVLAGGGNVENGKYRIYSYFLQEHTAKEKADFLKKEYGIGGFGRLGYNEWHDSKGISFSRENHRMPYDKVILSWPKVARRIDELITDGRFMSAAQLAYLPEYEKHELARRIYSFFPYGQEDLPRPFPYGTDYSNAVKIIRPQLDEPERVAEILGQMAAILDNTADFDRNYEAMRRAFDNLTAYQNGTFSLFKLKQIDSKKLMADNNGIANGDDLDNSSLSPVNSQLEYPLQLGASVYIGTDEYEIYSFDDSNVILRDVSAPLFTQNMTREEFDRKLRENRLNDSFIKALPSTDYQPQQSARDIFDEYLPLFISKILFDQPYMAAWENSDSERTDRMRVRHRAHCAGNRHEQYRFSPCLF